MSSKPKSFSESMKELEEIVDWFETSDVNVDEAVKKYERGAEIIESLKSQLESAQNTVKKIQTKVKDSGQD